MDKPKAVNLGQIVLACGTRLVDVPDIGKLYAVRGHAMDRVRYVKINTDEHEWAKTGVFFDTPGSQHCEAKFVYADREKAYAAAIHAARAMADRLEKKAMEGVE